MTQIKFGSLHTAKKLDCLEKYLKAYLTVFKNKTWARTIYVDAFAGTGEIPTASAYDALPLGLDGQAFVIGSAQRALGLNESFDEYIFIEKKKGNAKALLTLRNAHPDKNISVTRSDANEGLRNLCANRDWKTCRAVIFLDPFGSQVAWRTLESIAQTKAVDLWYLFPAGLSVYRQIGANGTVHYTHEDSLDRIFGVGEWRTQFIDTVQGEPDLFGHASPARVKTATPESVTRYMHKRMSEVFHGGVLDDWLPLGGNGGHWYSLMFACSNPSPTAYKLAMKLARAVLRSGKRGGSK